MKINLRWLIQALAFIGCIFFFLQIWDVSKELVINFSSTALWICLLYVSLFSICFFLMVLTSYLKQKFNGTLKNPIPFFEKLLRKMGLA